MANVSHMLRSKQAGFSLLETIAAIVLLALAFGAVMHVAGAATQLTGHARELNRVAMLADTTLDAAGRLECSGAQPVSYTHLTLPTKLL